MTTTLQKSVAAAKKDSKLANNWKTKAAEELTDAEVLAMPDASQTYISHVSQHATDCSHRLGAVIDDDAVLVARHGEAVLGHEEYDWLKSELAKRGEDVEDLTWQIT